MTIAKMPDWQSPEIKAWFQTEYPKYVAQVSANVQPSAPREEWDTDNRAEIAARKRELANVAIQNAVRLIREADAIEQELIQ